MNTKDPLHSSVGRAMDCKFRYLSIGPWFDPGWRDFLGGLFWSYIHTSFAAASYHCALIAPHILNTHRISSLSRLRFGKASSFINMAHCRSAAKCLSSSPENPGVLRSLPGSGTVVVG